MEEFQDGQHSDSDLSNDESDHDDDAFESEDSDLEEFRNMDYGNSTNLREFLIWYAVHHRVPRTHVSTLLKGLKRHIEQPYGIDLDLPKDFRSLLKTPRDVSHLITELEGGKFGNLGFKNGIERIIKQGVCLDDIRELKVTCFLDGFSPYKKRSKKFWALLHKVDIPGKFSPVFMSGLYVGSENPANFNHLLQNFVDEFNELKREPVMLEGFDNPVRIVWRCAICDMPAKGDAKGVKYSGYGSCDNCEQVGQFVKSVILPDLTYVLRTNEKFRS
jgi:hypothetical protein